MSRPSRCIGVVRNCMATGQKSWEWREGRREGGREGRREGGRDGE